MAFTSAYSARSKSTTSAYSANGFSPDIWTSCIGSVLLLLVVAAYVAVSQARPSPETLQVPADNVEMELDPEVQASRRFDKDVNLVRLDFMKEKAVDPRQGGQGWMLDPIKTQEKVGLKGGSLSCLEVHLGQVVPGKMRGNHRHHFCNETIILWGAKQRVRVENPRASQGYSEVVIGPDEVAVLAGPVGLAHAIFNLDKSRVAYLLACQDGEYDVDNPRTDYKVWDDI